MCATDAARRILESRVLELRSTCGSEITSNRTGRATRPCVLRGDRAVNQRRIWLVFTVLALSCTLKDQSLTSERAQARRNPSQNKRLTSKQEVAPNPTDRKKMSTDSTQSVLISGPQKHHRYRLTVAPNSVS